MKVVALNLLLTFTVVNAELLQMLNLLQTSDVYHYLAADEQVLLTEIVAAGEACKLHGLVKTIGRDPIASLIVHLPGQEETLAHDYIADHLQKENDGTCVVDATPRPTHRPTRPS